MSDKTKKSSGSGCFRGCFIGAGCGCIYPLFGLIVVVIGLHLLFSKAVKQIYTPINIIYNTPTQQDYWSLNEKRNNIAVNTHKKQTVASEPLVLNFAEFNALLSYIDLKPAYGYFLDNIKFGKPEGENTFYLIGSGFFIRNLVISIKTADNYRNNFKNGFIKALRFNKLDVTDPGIIHRLAVDFVYRFLHSNGIDDKLISDIFKNITFKKNSVIIYRPDLWLKLIKQVKGNQK